MNQVEKVVIEALKEVFSGLPASVPGDIDCNELRNEMNRQSVYTLSYGWLKSYNYINMTNYKESIAPVLRQTSRWYFMMDELNNLSEILGKEGHVFAVLKGCANAALYPVPELRQSNDIDILVKKDEYEDIYHLLVEKGYSPAGEIDKTKHHFEVSNNGVLIEVHIKPGGMHRKEKKKHEQLMKLFQDGLEKREWIQVYNYKIPVLPKLQNGIMLLLHTAQHMSTTGMGLRHLLDWMVYADKYLSDEYWHGEFNDIAKFSGVDILAKTLTKTCQIYLGLRKDITWCQDVESELCQEMIEYFVEQGEFGNKSSDKVAKMVVENTSLVSFIRHFDQSSVYSLPIAKKYCFLRPLAWLYQLARYFVILIKKAVFRETTVAIKNSLATGRKRKDFFAKLNIWQDDM